MIAVGKEIIILKKMMLRRKIGSGNSVWSIVKVKSKRHMRNAVAAVLIKEHGSKKFAGEKLIQRNADRT